MADVIGKSLGRYMVTEQLGEGGMAIIYKAFDSDLERYVAIKMIRAEVSGAADFRERFKREARALAKLAHPNIVRVLDYGEFEGAPYLVMEYVPGGSLRRRPGIAMPWQDAARMLAPIAHALEYAHGFGIVHRDVKPSNFLVAEGAKLMLSDFGIAYLLDGGDQTRITKAGVGIGTPEYMAPEQGLGHSIGPRVDVYALGVVFYEMVVGRVPFQADTPMAVVVKQINDPLPPPRSQNPALPEMVEMVLLKALAKNPEERYASMAHFAAALEKLAGGGQPAAVDLPRTLTLKTAAPPTPADSAAVAGAPAAASRRRSPALLVALAAALLVAMCCLGMWGLYLGNVCLTPAMPWCGQPIPANYNRLVCPPPGNWPLPPWCEPNAE